MDRTRIRYQVIFEYIKRYIYKLKYIENMFKGVKLGIFRINWVRFRSDLCYSLYINKRVEFGRIGSYVRFYELYFK